jgi:uncharacterized protein YxjI
MADELELDWGSRTPRDPKSPASTPAPEEAPRAVRADLPPWHPERLPDGMGFRLGAFFTTPKMRVHQAMELAQALIGWDQANLFSVRSDDHELLFTAAEKGRGLLGSLSRNFNPFYRNTTECLTADGSRFLSCFFPFTLWLRRCEVSAWNSALVGVVRNRLHLLKYRADLESARGEVLAEVHGPVLKFLSFTDWVFEVRQAGVVVARIRKHWGGWFREAFSTSDRFSVEFEPQCQDARLRLLVFAAALLVDASAFEQRGSRGGSLLDLFDTR